MRYACAILHALHLSSAVAKNAAALDDANASCLFELHELCSSVAEQANAVSANTASANTVSANIVSANRLPCKYSRCDHLLKPSSCLLRCHMQLLHCNICLQAEAVANIKSHLTLKLWLTVTRPHLLIRHAQGVSCLHLAVTSHCCRVALINQN